MKTPAKAKDAEEPASEKVEEPVPKAKKGKTPVKAKAKAAEEEAPEEAEETPVSKPKKVKTPAKAKVAAEVAPPEAADKTPASKSKKEKTPSKPAAVEQTPSKEPERPTPKSKKGKTPSKEPEQPTPTNKKEVTPAKEPEQPTPKSKKEKTPAKASQTPKSTPKEPAVETPVTKQAKKPKSAKKAKAEPEPVPEPESKATEQANKEAAAPQDEDNVSVEEEADEQTKALVQTVDAQDDDEPESGVVLFEEGQDVGKIPKVSNKEKKRAKKALAAAKEKEETGVIYIGRLPHGFYEHEMKSYFSQFGPIRNLRVSRNKKTGKPKHFAFVEFEDASTAEIVAKTMDVSRRHSSGHSRLWLTSSRTTCSLVTFSNAVSFQRPRSTTTSSRARTRDSRYVDSVRMLGNFRI